MNTNHKFEIGDVVEFHAKRGKRKGVISGLKYKTPGKRRFTGTALEPFLFTTQIAVIPIEGDGVWKVPVTSLTFIEKSKTEQLQSAFQYADQLYQNRADHQSERKLRRLNDARDNNLFNIVPGDLVMVEFKHGYKEECRFVRAMQSGRVMIRQSSGREVSVPPRFVKPIDKVENND